MLTHILDANDGQVRVREGHDQSLPISQTNRILTLADAPSDSAVALWRVYDLDSHERISNVEELEFSEICVGGV